MSDGGDGADGGPLRVGTRGSALARTQTAWVVARLERLGLRVVVETISTAADVRADVPIATLGGDGVFVRELERALLDGRIDLAVHSLKDMPTTVTPGLEIACVPERETPFDVLVARGPATLETLPAGAVIGTSSVRRVAQVRRIRGDLVVRPLRGNVDSRLRRLDAGELDGLVLAGAGLARLGLAVRVSQVLRPDAFWPAVSQGALGVQVRADDLRARDAVARLDHAASHAAVRAERSCLATLAGGCLAPIGAWGRLVEDGRLKLGGCVLEEADGVVTRIVAEGDAPLGDGDGVSDGREAEELGTRIAADLQAAGAAAMLARMRSAGGAAAG